LRGLIIIKKDRDNAQGIKKTIPTFLTKPFAKPYRSLTRSNVGSFLDAFIKKHGGLHEPRNMLPHFLQYLGQHREELSDLQSFEIRTNDATTRGIYDILRAKIDARKRKPKASPKQQDGDPDSDYRAHEDHNKTWQKRPYPPTDQSQDGRVPGLRVVGTPIKATTNPSRAAAKAPAGSGPALRKRWKEEEDEITLSEHDDSKDAKTSNQDMS